MAKTKKTTLPKNFAELLDKGDLSELIAVFDICEVNARGGYSKQTALAFDECPAELVKWLIANGADIEATDTQGNSPLHRRSRSYRGRIIELIELGADIHSSTSSIGTPLHAAASSYKVENAKLLLEHGAKVNLLNKEQLSPLDLALRGCANYDIERMELLAQVLLASGAKQSPLTKEFIIEIGRRFEFHRAGFNPDSVEAVDIALNTLYKLFQVPPVPKRLTHDGKTPIAIKTKNWQEQHEELWNLLVPSSGPSETVQGEVIRISGRIGNELDGNGGGNWDMHYDKMADAFLQHTKSGLSLSVQELEELTQLVSAFKQRSGETARMAELAVKWLLQNPIPTKLDTPAYKR